MQRITLLTSLVISALVSSAIATAQTQFAPPMTVGIASSPGGLVTADFNRDGFPDLAATTGLSSTLQVALGAGDGTIGFLAPYPIVGHGCAGDVNGDGFADLMLVRPVTGFVEIAVNNGAGGFSTLPTLNLGGSEFAQIGRVADMNLDGNLDIVVTSLAALFTPHIVKLHGNGAGGFGPPLNYATTASMASRMEVADVNHDGAPEPVTLSGKQGLVCYLNNGTGGLGTPKGAFFGIGFFPSGLDFADVNGDGFPDAGIAGQDATGLAGSGVVLLGNSAGQYPVIPFTPVAYPPAGLAFRDVTCDGIADLVMGESNADKIAVLTSSPAGGLSGPVEYPALAQPVGGPLATDLDGDGRIDIALVVTGPVPAISTIRNVTPYAAGIAPFGTGTPGCDGIHGLTTNSSPAIGNLDYGYLVTQAPRNTLGLVLSTDAADVAGSDPFAIFVTLHVNLFASTEIYAFDLYTDAFGGGFAPVPIPNNPFLQGLTFYTQALFAWSGTCLPTPFGLSTSRALVKTIQ